MTTLTESQRLEVEKYQETLHTQTSRLMNEFEDLKGRWRSLEACWDGQASDEVKAYWKRVTLDFENYFESAEKLQAYTQNCLDGDSE